jgi:6,7-dimethyl-8-ribityllumazine synthase
MIVASRFNREITDGLVRGALSAFREKGVAAKSVDLRWVPGAFELPVAALQAAKSRRYRAVVALGCLLQGETHQFEYIAQAVYQGLSLASVLTGVPVTSGVITARTWKQAVARSTGTKLHRGKEAALAALALEKS